MTTPPAAEGATAGRKVLEGVFGINKPQWASSAGVLRDLQTEFAKSDLFQPWLEHTRRQMRVSGSKKKHIDQLKVKLGHGGTLDPLATGVLIVGVGRGTKELGKFLDCTKSYECVVLFGAATDSYDAVGKVVSKADYAHVTRELVEQKLADFRGSILQKPSIFSALKVDGKKMYEYAREGKDIPDVAARPVTVEKLELVEWLEPGTHDFTWPEDEVDAAGKAGAEKLLGIRAADAAQYQRNTKRARSPAPESSNHADKVKVKDDTSPQSKKPRTTSPPPHDTPASPSPKVATASTTISAELANEPQPLNTDIPEPPVAAENQPADSVEQAFAVDEACTSAGEHEHEHKHEHKHNKAEPSITDTADPAPTTTSTPSPPAARLRMTVTSGFYVRSLCHDLGLACSSLALMSSLIRTRQGEYELGGLDVLEYEDLLAGKEGWEGKVGGMLERWGERAGWVWEEVVPGDEGEGGSEGMGARGERERGRGRRGKWRGGGGGGGGGRRG